jgi:hypothetical protein
MSVGILESIPRYRGMTVFKGKIGNFFLAGIKSMAMWLSLVARLSPYPEVRLAQSSNCLVTWFVLWWPASTLMPTWVISSALQRQSCHSGNSRSFEAMHQELKSKARYSLRYSIGFSQLSCSPLSLEKGPSPMSPVMIPLCWTLPHPSFGYAVPHACWGLIG